MNLIIVVPSHNMNEKCYENVLALHNQLPQAKMIVVNNDSTRKEYLEKLPSSIIVEDNIYQNSFEPGALLFVFEKYESENYFLIQDSIEMVDCYEISDYVEKDYNFVLALNLFCPAVHMMTAEHKDYIKNNFKTLSSSLFMQAGIAMNSFIAKRSHLQKIKDEGYFVKEKLPNSKLGSESWERVFGLSFYKSKINLKCFQASYSRELFNSVQHLSEDKILHLIKYRPKFNKYLFGRS